MIGIRPGGSREGANEHLSATIVTTVGQTRNAVIVWAADAVISVGESWETLSEIAVAKCRGGIPVVSLNGWPIVATDGSEVPGGIVHVDNAEAAVSTALAGISG